MPEQVALGAQLAALGERMQHLDKSIGQLSTTIEALDKRFVTIPMHQNSFDRFDSRISVLEEERRERKVDGGFFGGARKVREVALTLTAVLAAIAAVAVIARGWPVH